MSALLAGLFLLLASYANWTWQWGGNLAKGNAFEAMLNGDSIWGSRLGWQVLGLAVAQLSLHLGAGAACWVLARISRAAWPDYPASQRQWVLLWLALGLLSVLLANAERFPRSTFGDHLYAYAELSVGGVSLATAVAALTAGLALLATGFAARRTFALRHRAGRAPRASWAALAGVGMLASSVALVAYDPATRASNGATDRPHVIIVGIDSLRCDVTRLAGGGGLTPNIDRFLEDSVRFTDAMTPLARTYPSWISILTGKHPHTTGAFVNLIHRDQIDLGDTLPEALRRAGYRTVYGIDEVRFSNVDESYGFDQTIMPPIGAADFILGGSNDTPLSNLVVNTRLGRWLFPFSHANRAAATTYDPATYVRRLEHELDFSRPTFLALHLTLAHWPFVWGSAKRAEIDDANNWTSSHYWPAVRRVDDMFADVLGVLRRKGALDNAIVVLLSDHGEAIGLPGDSPYAMSGPPEDPFAWTGITGHGSSVLSPHQYRVVLALRQFGAGERPLGAPRDIGAPVSLEDVAPTLDEWLGLRMAPQFDGHSLLPLLRDAEGAQAPHLARIRFTETEFNPRGFIPGGQLPPPSAIDLAMRHYEIDRATGRMNIRRSERAKLLKQRQYAALRGREMVAALPGNYTPGFRYVYIDGSRGGLPRSLDGRPDRAVAPGAAELWDALHARFAEPLASMADDGSTR